MKPAEFLSRRSKTRTIFSSTSLAKDRIEKLLLIISMWLLQVTATGGYSLVEFTDLDTTPNYAILSHTWGLESQEVTFADIMNGLGRSKTGYQKLQFCAEQAAKDGLSFFWIDTCCINKASSAEISEAILSMFRWFQNARKCYALLSDVSISNTVAVDKSTTSTSTMRHSRWFTRSWTLQELLAPKSVEFFASNGDFLGNRISLLLEIHSITGIPMEALQGKSLCLYSVDERLSWSQARAATREEDTVYSLLGIFNVFMPLLYGEGRGNALLRLRERTERSSYASDSAGNIRRGASYANSNFAFSIYGSGLQFNCFEGPQNLNFGGGRQFAGTINGSVYF